MNTPAFSSYGFRLPGGPVLPLVVGNLFEIAKNVTLGHQPESTDSPAGLWTKVLHYFHILLLYIGKIFYSRTFSLTTMPRFILLPALIMSFRLYRHWHRQKEYGKILLPAILWFYLVIYLLRSSYGRYLLPVVPIIILFFIMFLRDGMKEKRFAKNTLIAVMVFAALGLYYEINFPLIKLILTLFFVSGLWYLYSRPGTGQSGVEKVEKVDKQKFLYIVMIGLCSIAITIGTSLVKPFQVGNFLAWGYNSQMKEIARNFKEKEKIWINCDRGLIQFYRHDRNYSIFKENQIKWQLNPL
ncbi:MAG: hypothetical protein GY757_37975, partial [bacterium]|nr:hypothetical protein [bacterium]